MTFIQQQSATLVTIEFKKRDKGGRDIPFELHRECQRLQLPNTTNLPSNLTYIEGRKHIPFKIQQDCQIIQLPKISDRRGSLSFIEGERHIPFKIQSAYWLYDVSDEARQDGYAYRGQHEFIIAISGSIDVVVDNGYENRRYCLNRPDFGLYVPDMVWRQIEDLSTDAVVLTMASQPDEVEDCRLDGFRELEVLQ